MRRWIRELPLDRLLLESDAPALGPVAGVPNEPGNIVYACREIARARGISAEEVARVTTENAYRLFPGLRGSASERTN